MKKELQNGTTDEQRTDADLLPSARVEASPMLSAALFVEEGNFLIAKFLGYKYQFINSQVFKNGLKDIHAYHEDWSRLMPVVEKINELFGPLTIALQVTTTGVFLNKVHNAICEVDIKKAHEEIISAIKWYNGNTAAVGSR